MRTSGGWWVGVRNVKLVHFSRVDDGQVSGTGPNHTMIRVVLFAIFRSRKNLSDQILDLHRGVMLGKSVFGPYLILEKFVLHCVGPFWQLFASNTECNL